jgi:hypothetical protein
VKDDVEVITLGMHVAFVIQGCNFGIGCVAPANSKAKLRFILFRYLALGYLLIQNINFIFVPHDFFLNSLS